jgi:hypothetical protein
VVTRGQGNDSAVLPEAIHDIREPRVGAGRPSTTPEPVLADRASPTRATREYLRSPGIRSVIPEKVDQVTARKKSSAGGRPPGLDAEAYKGRDVDNRAFN